MLKPLLVCFIFTFSGVISDTGEIEVESVKLVNPNTASVEELYQVPFLSSYEIQLILIQRRERPYKDINDFSQRLGLLPFEKDYLENLLYFQKIYRLYWNWYFYYRQGFRGYITLKYTKIPLFSVWKYASMHYPRFFAGGGWKGFKGYIGFIKPELEGEFNGRDFAKYTGMQRDTLPGIFIGYRYVFFHFNSRIKQVIVLVKGLTLRYVYQKGISLGYSWKNKRVKVGRWTKDYWVYVGIKGRREQEYFRLRTGWIFNRGIRIRLFTVHQISKRLYVRVSSGYFQETSSVYGYLFAGGIFKLLKRFHFIGGVKKYSSKDPFLYIGFRNYGRGYLNLGFQKSFTDRGYSMKINLSFSHFHLSYSLCQHTELIEFDEIEQRFQTLESSETFALSYRFKIKFLKIEPFYRYNEADRVYGVRIAGRLSF